MKGSKSHVYILRTCLLRKLSGTPQAKRQGPEAGKRGCLPNKDESPKSRRMMGADSLWL